MHMTIVILYAFGSLRQGPADGAEWHVHACEGMRYMLCVGFVISLCLSFVTHCGDRSKWYVAQTKYVRLRGWPLLLLCSRAPSEPAKCIQCLAIVYYVAE